MDPRGWYMIKAKMTVMHLPVVVILASVVSVDAAAPRTFLWQEVGNPSCVRCCEASEEPAEPPKKSRIKEYVVYPMPRVQPRIEMTILKGEKGEMGGKGPPGVSGKEGERGSLGPQGFKGQKGQTGPSGNSCKIQYAAFSVARRKSIHSTEYFQNVVFDTVFVNLYEHFNMFSGTFICYIPGIYFFNLNVHTWNLKETYLHIMKNSEEIAILYAQPSDRSIMQSQSLMLHLKDRDEVWVRMFKRERENALYNDETDVYIIFNGYLVKAMDD
ncbi:complement C1q tumor necrosis factor-related protein 8 isoform X1 [Bufo bufo]|uniref:complement C1q tumor necrosis factor-related protein 8 isoform X1 n=2 Tax=Bufo bufo TaxID=8384 RepID=UPI001ABED167|nr:complement C1q tumor necrosis factor-related protein 8 isoform X1 [Bufo bufo]XP_040296375.1 complement C1q tumor necrosis factor-related protein 8 isoform X1 [Bufo bufo]